MFVKVPKKWGSTEIRTRIVGFKVQSDSHYTIEPLFPFLTLFILLKLFESQHNMGMLITPKWLANLKKHALGRVFDFDEIKNFKKSWNPIKVFCTHDDYNWDYSLMRVSQNQDWKVIYPKFPRVYHLGGECGYHTKEGDFSCIYRLKAIKQIKSPKRNKRAIQTKWCKN